VVKPQPTTITTQFDTKTYLDLAGVDSEAIKEAETPKSADEDTTFQYNEELDSRDFYYDDSDSISEVNASSFSYLDD
jgi:hypothetical protein